MQPQELHNDINILTHQLNAMKMQMETAISAGKSFAEVKAIHLQIKALSGLIENLQNKNNRNIAEPMNQPKGVNI
jgi:hypothetical protein